MIRYGTSSGNYTRTIDVGNVASYSINTLSDGVRYYFSVQGYNASRQYSPRSNEVSGVAGAAATLPGAPRNLTASVSGTSVNLAWQAPSGSVSGYRIEVGTSSGQSNVRTVNTSSTTYTLTGLAAGTYYIRVRSVSSAGQSAPSNEVTARISTTSTGAPQPPSSLTATVRSDRSVYLTWRAPSGTVSGYRIGVGTASGQSNVRTINTSATTYSITGLATGTYYIRVRSVNSSGTSGPSNEVRVTIGSSRTSAPQPPTSLAGWTRSDGAIYLTWRAPSGTVTGYRVEAGTSPGATNVFTRSLGTATNYTVTGLRSGIYYFRVRAVNSAGVSAPSQELKKTVGTTSSPTSGAPQPPGNLAGWTRPDGGLNLTWTTPSSTVTGYRLEAGTSPGATNVFTRSLSTATNYTVTGLRSGIYYFRVRSVNSSGVSAPSQELKKTIGSSNLTATSALSSPTDLTATLRDDGVIDLSWQAQDPSASLYRVELGTQPSQTDVSTFTTGVTTSVSIGKLPARTYYVRVRSGDEEGFGEPSAEVVVAGRGGHDAPRGLTAAANANGGIRLAWDAPQNSTGVVGYLIEAGRAPGRADLATFQTTERSITSGPVADGTYFVRVRSLTAAGAGPASNEIVVHVGAPPQCTAPPAAPLLNAQVIGTMVNLSWSPGAGGPPTGYLLDVGTIPGRRDIASIPLGTDATTLTTEVQNGSYALRLIAVNACGVSVPSAGTVVTVGGPEVVLPGTPANLTHQVNERSATLTWSPATTGGPVTSYVVEVVSPAGEVLLSIDTGNTSTTFTHGSVPPGEYTVRVRGVNARGAGDPSTTVTVAVDR